MGFKEEVDSLLMPVPLGKVKSSWGRAVTRALQSLRDQLVGTLALKLVGEASEADFTYLSVEKDTAYVGVPLHPLKEVFEVSGDTSIFTTFHLPCEVDYTWEESDEISLWVVMSIMLAGDVPSAQYAIYYVDLVEGGYESDTLHGGPRREGKFYWYLGGSYLLKPYEWKGTPFTARYFDFLIFIYYVSSKPCPVVFTNPHRPSSASVKLFLPYLIS